VVKLSAFGERFAGPSGIVDLMDDLDHALRLRPDTVLMGGGNPARIPAVDELYRERLIRLIDDPQRCEELLGVYQVPRGDARFREALAASLRAEYGWDVGPENIAVSNGSQPAFFVLFNLFAGRSDDGSARHIQLPLVPEYVGYREIGLDDGMFRSQRPSIELLPDQLFKYGVDFSRLRLDGQTGAVCVSRPTNPTGNVLTSAEISQLDALARQAGVPLIIDGAYGTPFPQMIFAPTQPFWNDNTVLVLSLSKLGLPGLRTGVVVASEEIIRAFARANTLLSLACGTLGPALAADLLADGSLLRLSREHIGPFYAAKAERALDTLRQGLKGLPVRIHRPEGAMFLWLWCEGLPGGTTALYERLKQRGVLVVPGASFFMGLDAPWPHTDECLRLSYAQPDEVVARGLGIVAAELRRNYGG